MPKWKCAGGDGDPKTMRSGAEELLAFSPDVIMVFTNLALSAVVPILGKVPAVFVAVGDPLAPVLLQASRALEATSQGSPASSPRWGASGSRS